MRKLQWIDTPEGLLEMGERLGGYDSIAIDAEMDSYFVYHTKLCLIQITAGQNDFLVDSLALKDLTPLNDVTQNPNIRKVFHAGENDVPFFRDRGVTFVNLFDTHFAAKILDLPSKGLAGLVELYFEVKLSKEHQRSDWRVRPLSDEQAEYARQDTLYLDRLADIVSELLVENEAEVEARESFVALQDFRTRPKEFDPDGWARIKGAKDLTGEQRSVLKLLVAWREEVASKQDLPPFRVANNGALVALSRKRFTKTEQLQAWAKGPTIKKWAHKLVQLLAEGKANGPIPMPDLGKKRFGGLSPQDEAVFQKLRQWRNKESESREVGPERVFSNRQLKAIAKAKPGNLSDLKAVQGIEPWRVEEFSQSVLELI